MNLLDQSETTRYHRQIRITGFGVEAQAELKKARVVIAGVGGLGCHASLSLTAAGVGRLRLVDNGLVELSNLNRQVLYRETDMGKEKALVAKKRLSQINPSVKLEAVTAEITGKNVGEVIEGAQVVVDGMDNFPTRMILNAACVAAGLPFIYGGIQGLKGMVTTILPGKTPCLSCIVPPSARVEEGVSVLGAVAAVIGSIQALEAVKCITGIGSPLAGKLLSFDGKRGRCTQYTITRKDACPVCGPTP